MSIPIAKPSKTSDVPLLEAGVYIARCVKMIHIGTNVENILGEDKTLNKVRLYFEIPSETYVFNEEKGEQPRMMSEEFTLSLHENANLRKFLEFWRGKSFTEKDLEDFDLAKLLEKPLMITVSHKTTKAGKEFACITGSSKMMKGQKCPKQITPTFEFSYEPFDVKKMDDLPDWIKEKVVTSVEYLEATGGQVPEQPKAKTETPPQAVEPIDEEVDDLPF